MSHPSNKEAWNVLHEDVLWSNHANNSGELWPKPTRICFTEPSPRDADRLTRETSADEVDRFKFIPPDLSDVTVLRHMRPMLLKDCATKRVDLYLPADLHARTLQTKIKAADTGEEAANLHPSIASKRPQNRFSYAGYIKLLPRTKNG